MCEGHATISRRAKNAVKRETLNLLHKGINWRRFHILKAINTDVRTNYTRFCHDLKSAVEGSNAVVGSCRLIDIFELQSQLDLDPV